jgi:hypothetical protein
MLGYTPTPEVVDERPPGPFRETSYNVARRVTARVDLAVNSLLCLEKDGW